MTDRRQNIQGTQNDKAIKTTETTCCMHAAAFTNRLDLNSIMRVCMHMHISDIILLKVQLCQGSAKTDLRQNTEVKEY